jgi:hypothetical protein
LFFAELSLSVGLQSFRIRTHPEFPARVVTGSSAPLHTSRAGSSGYSASFLAMRSYTLIIVVGASVSVQDFDVIEATTYCRLHLGHPLILPTICLPRPSTLSPYHPTTTSAFSSTFAHRHFPMSTRARSSLQQRVRCAMRSQKRAIFMRRIFRLS